MKLAYKAVSKTGQQAEDRIEAASIEEATEKLRQRGLFVTSMTAADDGDRAVARSSRGGGKHLKELTLWSRQISVLVRSGTPLAQALEAIEAQTAPGPWCDGLQALRASVEHGGSLSDAMGDRPDLFDDVTRSLIAAGETSGQLGDMLDRVALLTRQQLRIRRTLFGALVYPALLLCVGLSVTLVMMLAVLPRFAMLFESLSAPLPPTTMFLMALSNLLRTQWLPLIIVGIGGVVSLKVGLATPAGRAWIDRTAVRLPVLGQMVRSLATARIARLLGVMLESHVPLLDALKLTCESTSNMLYGKLMRDAVAAATRGEAISAIFARSTLINASVTEAVRHGERNGQIGPILTDMADFLDEENEVIVKTAMSVLEPLILIGLGLVVGFIALSLFIPLFDLTSMAGA